LRAGPAPHGAIASAVRAGRLSFAFLEGSPYRRWALRSARTYRQVSEESGVPLDTLAGVLEAMGFARMAPDEPIREDELEIVPLLRLARFTGILDPVWLTRIGRAYAEGLRLAANVENEAYRARFTGPVLDSGADQRTAMELASQMAADFLPLVDRTLAAIYRRQQELVWTEDMVEDIERELERAGVLRRPERIPAMSFVDLVGYTRLTEERGDAAAAELAASLAVLVNRSAREHGGVPVKRLGDGVLVHFREPAGAVLSALRMVEQLPEAGLPPAHVGSRPGRWWPRAATTSAAPSTWPPASPPTPGRGRCWSAGAWSSPLRPLAWRSSRSGRYRSRGSRLRCGCSRRGACFDLFQPLCKPRDRRPSSSIRFDHAFDHLSVRGRPAHGHAGADPAAAKPAGRRGAPPGRRVPGRACERRPCPPLRGGSGRRRSHRPQACLDRAIVQPMGGGHHADQ
jgi:hypothetical protein